MIISDIDMPVVNGVDLLESAKIKGCQCRHLALISGKGLTDEGFTRMEKYGVRYFPKPLNRVAFYAWLEEVETDIANDPHPVTEQAGGEN